MLSHTTSARGFGPGHRAQGGKVRAQHHVRVVLAVETVIGKFAHAGLNGYGAGNAQFLALDQGLCGQGLAARKSADIGKGQFNVADVLFGQPFGLCGRDGELGHAGLPWSVLDCFIYLPVCRSCIF
jgi:hypothetical protein